MATPARIVVLPGDGIGPEVTVAARRVLDAAVSRVGIALDYVEDVVGGAAVDAYGVALRPQTLRLCKTADAILFGAVGGPKWDDAAPDSKLRPGSALLGLRKGLGLFANLRPVKVDAAMVATSALRPERVRDVDLLVVRELTGGLYFSRPKRRYMTARGEAACLTDEGERGGGLQPGKPGRGVHGQDLPLPALPIDQGLALDSGSHG